MAKSLLKADRLLRRLSGVGVNNWNPDFLALPQPLVSSDSGNGGLLLGPLRFTCFDSRSAPISV